MRSRVDRSQAGLALLGALAMLSSGCNVRALDRPDGEPADGRSPPSRPSLDAGDAGPPSTDGDTPAPPADGGGPVPGDLGRRDLGRTDGGRAEPDGGAATAFEEPRGLAGLQVVHLVTGDLDGDRADEVIFADPTGQLHVVFGNPDGTLGNGPEAPLIAEGVGWLAAADVDGDGHLDVVAASPAGGKLSWLRGLGDRSFEAPRDIAVPTPMRVALFDLDGDGLPEAIVGSEDATGAGAVHLLRGLGKAGFAPPQLLRRTRLSPEVILPGKFLDSSGPGFFLEAGGLTEILLQRPGLTFEARPLGETDEVRHFAQEGASANLDDNDLTDVVVVDDSFPDSGHISIYTLSERTYGLGGLLGTAPALHPRGVALADLNGDGRVDVALAGQEGISIHRNRGVVNDFAYILERPDEGLASNNGPLRWLKAADLDGDGRPDLVTTCDPGACLLVYRNVTPPGR